MFFFFQHGEVLPLKIITYTTVSASLVALLITFLLLAILRKLRSNLHSIHRNLVAAIFLSELVFLFGINQTENTVWREITSLLCSPTLNLGQVHTVNVTLLIITLIDFQMKKQ